MNTIKILLADDHVVVRQGVRLLLEQEKDLAVIGGANNGREAVTMALDLKPDIVLMDIAMPELNGLEATRQIIHHLPVTKIIILSAHGDDAYVSRAISAGASGFLLKQSSFLDLCKSIRDVIRGRLCLTTSLARRYRHLHPNQSPGSPKAPVLTSRETEVLQLIAEGKPNKQSAEILGISIKTVEKHRSTLMAKLDIHDTAGLALHAFAIGLLVNSRSSNEQIHISEKIKIEA